MYSGVARIHILGSSLANVTLDRVRPSHVEGWIVELRRKGLAESTIRSAYTILRAVPDTAVRDGALGSNPAAAIRRPRVTAKKAPHLTPAQVADLLRAAEGGRYASLFALLVHTGLRRGEALALKWSDVDLSHAILRVRGTLSRIDGQLVVTEPKTAKSKRFVPIFEPADHLLRAQQAAQDDERRHAGSAWRQTGFVFTTEFGEPCDPRNAFRALRIAAAKAGLPNAGLHTLRHSAASVMLTRGVPLKVVSEILGHSSIAITGDIYGHVSPDVARQAMSTLGEAFDWLPTSHHACGRGRYASPVDGSRGRCTPRTDARASTSRTNLA